MDNPPPGWTVPHSTGFGISRIGKSLEQIKQSAWGKLDQQQRASAYSAAKSKRILEIFKQKYVDPLTDSLPQYVTVKFPIGPEAAGWIQQAVVNNAVPEVPDNWDGGALPPKVPAPPSSEAQAVAAAELIGADENSEAKSRLIKSLLYNPAIQAYRIARINGPLGDLDSSTADGKRNLRVGSNPFTYTPEGNRRFNNFLNLFYGGIKTQRCELPEPAVYRYCQQTIPVDLDTLLTSFITNNIITNFAPPEEICTNLAEAAAAQDQHNGAIAAPIAAAVEGGGGEPLQEGAGRRNATRRKAKRNQKARRRTR